MLAHLGSLFSCSRLAQWLYDFSRQANIQGGSFFLAEIRRMVYSLSPRGAESDSISVTNPYRYSRFASSSICSVVAAMPVSFLSLLLWIGARSRLPRWCQFNKGVLAEYTRADPEHDRAGRPRHLYCLTKLAGVCF